ncbi:7-carboxy-7-deazaguanine synthase [Ruminiclostridium sufflavum DSM 19573]|uniref:7-carboxy-7-deazaguanine synthase n=1 Tax=Ruminiclostridium sufflavum DSM 19573 TaxID=1121337 RepID=A0A318XIR7_9FIRM|nr:putative 7-carboxy-7-deazaguanine synthase QueE [Ruminiclostridium sufflavum]PYG87120.1 7-carboxy-7-deazaguanine synthase [Ruminiclostridium sufflavum DSM 19573]
MKYRVAEKFISINGEGNAAGQLAVFIRFAGCNLNCSYCDTKWANNVTGVKYNEFSEEDIFYYIKETGVENVTLTGGEPLLQEGIIQLLSLLSADGTLRVEIETNGSIELNKFINIKPRRPVFTMDYKLGSSEMETAMKTGNFELLCRQDTVKFVAGSIGDLETAKELIAKYHLTHKCQVHFSPVFGKIDMQTIVEFIKKNKMNGVRLQPQIHKIIWHPDMRGV